MQIKWKNEWIAPSIASVISFTAGVIVGYIFVTYRYKKTSEKIVERAIGEMHDDIVQLQFKLDDRSKNIHEAMEYAWNIVSKTANDEGVEEISHDYTDLTRPNHPSKPGFVPEVVSIFTEEDPEDDWSYEEELVHRTQDVPYVIHIDEFDGEELDYSHSTLTYYKGDDVLVDEHDIPIYNAKSIVGELKFDHGSNDPSVCYIRNDRLQAEYEILLEHGYYQVEVLGSDIEDKFKPEKAQVPKFRME